MPKSLRCKIKKLCYNGTLTERERDRILKALEQEPREEDIHREREQAYMLGYEDASKKFRTEPSEDCISRQAVIDAINFEDEWLLDAKSHNADTNIAFSAIKSKISELPSITPRRDLAETSQDCVSRKAVRKILVEAKEYGSWDDSSQINRQDALDYVDMLPPVKPKYTDEEIDKAQAVEQAYVDKMVELAVEESKRPRGKWINKFGKEQGYDIAGIKTWYIQIMCDKCGFIKTAIEGHTGQYKYCPNCGAEMGGGEDG